MRRAASVGPGRGRAIEPVEGDWVQLITDTSFGAAGQMGRVDAPPRRPEWTLVDWPEAIISVPTTALRMAFPSVVHPGRPGGRRALSAPAEPRPPQIGTGFHRGSNWSRDMGDVVRRLKLLKGTRAAIGRRGFDAVLKVLATASSEDIMEAMNIAGPKESIAIPLTPRVGPPPLRSGEARTGSTS